MHRRRCEVLGGLGIGVPFPVSPPVGGFQRLAALADNDAPLRQKLQQVLKLTKDKWEETREHAMRAVVADDRARIW
jgi:hypothetical protein